MTPTAATTNGTITMKKSAKSAIDAPRANVFLVYPEELFIIEDEKNPLFDPRALSPVPDRFIKNIMARGVKKPVLVRKVGNAIEVIDGRQRTRAAREVNKLVSAEGGEKRRIPVIVDRGVDDGLAFESSIFLNEIRKDDETILDKAEKAQRLLGFSRTIPEVATAFGVTEVTIRNWLALLELPSEAKRAVRSGRISATDAVKHLSDVESEKLEGAIEKLEKSSPKNGKSAKGKSDGETKKESPLARVRRIYRDEEAMAALPKREKVFIQWIFGQVTNGDLVTEIPALAPFVRHPKA
jgi:ParB/RepB/Spo0J family partition protein